MPKLTSRRLLPLLSLAVPYSEPPNPRGWLTDRSQQSPPPPGGSMQSQQYGYGTGNGDSWGNGR